MRLLARIQPLTLKRYLLLLAASATVGILFYLFIYYGGHGHLPGLRQRAGEYLSAVASTALFGWLLLLLDGLLDKAIHWRTNFLLRFISGLGAGMTLAVLFFTLAGKYWFQSTTEVILKLNMLFTIAVFIYEIFYGLFYSYRYYAVIQAEQLQSDRWQLELQFESLKSQISPHYLFNCLNTVSALLYKDSRIAEEFVRRMADTFRYVLGNQKHRLVTLREELEFVKSYYFLLQVRYEYHLQMEVNVPASLMDTLIPPMTLQLLVENAVKHNAISKEQPLLVYIGAQDNTHLTVYNTKTQTLRPTNSFRVGLENIHKRYGLFTSEPVRVTDGERFQVQLPVLHPASTLAPNMA
ncbi:MAG: histidine kinase [Cyclobacteriaceae bacterium]|nr:histidine kinase [Cyclobacteriaceae bacterium]